MRTCKICKRSKRTRSRLSEEPGESRQNRKSRGSRPRFDLRRRQRAFKSDFSLGSKLEIGRRNSRGRVRSISTRGFRARGARVGDRQFYEWGGTTTRGSNAAPIRSVPLPRGSWLDKEKKRDRERERGARRLRRRQERVGQAARTRARRRKKKNK